MKSYIFDCCYQSNEINSKDFNGTTKEVRNRYNQQSIHHEYSLFQSTNKLNNTGQGEQNVQPQRIPQNHIQSGKNKNPVNEGNVKYCNTAKEIENVFFTPTYSYDCPKQHDFNIYAIKLTKENYNTIKNLFTSNLKFAIRYKDLLKEFSDYVENNCQYPYTADNPPTLMIYPAYSRDYNLIGHNISGALSMQIVYPNGSGHYITIDTPSFIRSRVSLQRNPDDYTGLTALFARYMKFAFVLTKNREVRNMIIDLAWTNDREDKIAAKLPCTDVINNVKEKHYEVMVSGDANAWMKCAGQWVVQMNHTKVDGEAYNEKQNKLYKSYGNKITEIEQLKELTKLNTKSAKYSNNGSLSSAGGFEEKILVSKIIGKFPVQLIIGTACLTENDKIMEQLKIEDVDSIKLCKTLMPFVAGEMDSMKKEAEARREARKEARKEEEAKEEEETKAQEVVQAKMKIDDFPAVILIVDPNGEVN